MKNIFTLTLEDIQRKYVEAQKIVLKTTKNMRYATKNSSHYDRSDNELKALGFIRTVNEGDFDSIGYYWFESDTSLIIEELKNILVEKFEYENNSKLHNLDYIEQDCYSFIPLVELAFRIELPEEDYIACNTLTDLAEVIIKISEGEQALSKDEENTEVVKALMERYKIIIDKSSHGTYLNHSSYAQRNHLLKLCDDAITLHYQQYKIDRHLGYIQGVLTAFGIIDLDAEITLCKEAFDTNKNLEERLKFIKEFSIGN